MYKVGDFVLYGIHGPCRVSGFENAMMEGKKIHYLILDPVEQDGSRYMVPMDQEAVMHKIKPVLTPEEMEALLQSVSNAEDRWIRDENVRKQNYRKLISSCDRKALLCMIRLLYQHRTTQKEAGRRIHQADENFLRDAERLISREIALVMKLDPGDALRYLQDKLKRE